MRMVEIKKSSKSIHAHPEPDFCLIVSAHGLVLHSCRTSTAALHESYSMASGGTP